MKTTNDGLSRREFTAALGLLALGGMPAEFPNRTEESIFTDYCRKVLKFTPSDSAKFRQICLLSADAVYRGIRSTHNDVNPYWTRDHEIGIPPCLNHPMPAPASSRKKIRRC